MSAVCAEHTLKRARHAKHFDAAEPIRTGERQVSRTPVVNSGTRRARFQKTFASQARPHPLYFLCGAGSLSASRAMSTPTKATRRESPERKAVDLNAARWRRRTDANGRRSDADERRKIGRPEARCEIIGAPRPLRLHGPRKALQGRDLRSRAAALRGSI